MLGALLCITLICCFPSRKSPLSICFNCFEFFELVIKEGGLIRFG